jgi:hypothetical protein
MKKYSEKGTQIFFFSKGGVRKTGKNWEPCSKYLKEKF